MPDPTQTDPNSQQSTVNSQPFAVDSQGDQPIVPAFQEVSEVPPINQSTNQPITEPMGTAAPVDLPPAPVNFPSMTSSPQKKFGGGKIIATILGLLVLVGGIGTGIYLTGQQQLFDQKAAQEGTCSCMNDNGVNVNHSGVCSPNGDCDCSPDKVKNNNCAGQSNGGGGDGKFCVFDDWTQHNVCVDGKRCANAVPRGEMGSQKGCTSDSQCTEAGYPNCATGGYCVAFAPPYCTPTVLPGDDGCVPDNTCTNGGGDTASCQNVKAYNTSWVLLTTAQLKDLDPGNHVNFCVTGSATGGSFDKAKFTINGVAQPETTIKRPGNEDFCDNYIIPANVTTFNITAQIHHATLGWK
ncbi:MAG TPA: hypothetical protein VL401_00780 [Alphaproteobacteria bacterium]|jgi:hypothetical protein|nr:hypothetical protein [Alphaproteobacteria bacterium]